MIAVCRRIRAGGKKPFKFSRPVEGNELQPRQPRRMWKGQTKRVSTPYNSAMLLHVLLKKIEQSPTKKQRLEN